MLFVSGFSSFLTILCDLRPFLRCSLRFLPCFDILLAQRKNTFQIAIVCKILADEGLIVNQDRIVCRTDAGFPFKALWVPECIRYTAFPGSVLSEEEIDVGRTDFLIMKSRCFR